MIGKLLIHAGHSMILAGHGYPFSAAHRFVKPMLPRWFSKNCGCENRAARWDKKLQRWAAWRHVGADPAPTLKHHPSTHNHQPSTVTP